MRALRNALIRVALVAGSAAYLILEAAPRVHY